MHESVTVHMAAPPQRVWDLVSDVTRIGSYSPETFEAEWIDGATGPARRGEVPGPREAQPEGHQVLDDLHRDRVRARAGRSPSGWERPANHPLNVWRYEIVPADGGCDVTESFTLAPLWWLRLYWALLGWSRGKTNRNNMRITLERIRDEVEAAPAAGPAA